MKEKFCDVIIGGGVVVIVIIISIIFTEGIWDSEGFFFGGFMCWILGFLFVGMKKFPGEESWRYCGFFHSFI